MNHTNIPLTQRKLERLAQKLRVQDDSPQGQMDYGNYDVKKFFVF